MIGKNTVHENAKVNIKRNIRLINIYQKEKMLNVTFARLYCFENRQVSLKQTFVITLVRLIIKA